MADQRVYLGGGPAILLVECLLDAFRVRFRYKIRDACGVCKVLRKLHDESSDCYTARRAEELRVVCILDPDSSSASHHVLLVWLAIVALQIGKLIFEFLHLMLKTNDIASGHFSTLRDIEILAVRVGPVAWTASRQFCVASSFPLRNRTVELARYLDMFVKQESPSDVVKSEGGKRDGEEV